MAKSLIAAARTLADVLERENQALKAMDLVQTSGLLAEKTAAIADLEAVTDASFAPPDPSLIPVARRLDDLARENQTLLERAIVAQQRVIGIVVGAAASVAADPNYGTCRRRARLAAMALSTRA